jgi:DNA polymerase V
LQQDLEQEPKPHQARHRPQEQYTRTILRADERLAVSMPAAGAQPLPLRGQRKPLRLPLASSSVAAGFPSPADDYIDVGIDLNEALIRHPSSTFFLRVSGDSMVEAGIQHGDLLVVDRSLEARPGQIVVAVLDGAFTLKRLVRHRGRLRLEAANSAYPPLELNQCGDVQIWGVAIHVIHPLGRHG